LRGRRGAQKAWRWLGALLLVCAGSVAQAAEGSGAALPAAGADTALPADVAGWMARMQRAALERNYTGTFVVVTDGGAASGSRIWHACGQDEHIERIEALDGPPRTIFRRNGEMRTFLHASHTAVIEPLTGSTPFAGAVPALAGKLDLWYRAERQGRQRVAGHEADVVLLRPRDALRYGYRVWSERRSGLVLRLQTVQADGRVREQASFLQLDLDAPVSLTELARAMDDLEGYRALTPAPQRKLQDAERAWTLREPVPGFALQGCRAPQAQPRTMQCSYSDGLASVSLFIEPVRPGTAVAGARWSAGATQALARPLDADTWLTAVGEVPLDTLVLFADRLVRAR
jgi:sigma-E factor negative regulatory protein RseB